MAKKKSLRVVGTGPAKLAADTIMDRALAARYGSDYVHLVALAIDVDRVFQATEEQDLLPFAWEVRLTEAYFLEHLDPAQVPRDLSLLEDVCLGILDTHASARPLGSQLTFAVYCAVQRGLLPDTLATVFACWRKPPTDLASEVGEMAGDASLLPRLATHCLETSLQPPLIEPVVQALKEFLPRPE